MDDSHRTAFLRQFRRHAIVVRRTRLLRYALMGLGLGTCGAALLAGTRFFLLPGLSPLVTGLACCLASAIGVAAGVAIGQYRRFDDQSVGLFLDARLGQGDTISAALQPNETTRLVRAVYERATQLLEAAAPMRPPILGPSQLALPLSLALLVPLLLIPPRTPSALGAPPGSDNLRMEGLPGLAALERLERLEALDPDKERQLDALLERARKLDAELEQGTERRTAQANIAQLRDEVDALQGELAGLDQQPGLSSAIDEFSKDSNLRAAEEALARGDIVRFDSEMRRLATLVEESAREAARATLERAREAAAQKGARALSSALSEQERLFDERERTAALLRQIASALPKEAGKQLSEAMSKELPEEALEELADAMEKALASLSEQELTALGEQLRKAIEDGEVGKGSLEEQELQRLADDFRSEQGQRELREMLERLSRQGDAADAQRGLREADEGLRQAQRRAAGVLPVPQATKQGTGTSGGDGNRAGASEGGPGKGPGAGDHAGRTAPVEGDELRALARPRLDAKLPLQGSTVGRTSARPGETAQTPQGSPLPGVGAEELRGVEHSNIPEEYREQVGRYFAP
jgi:hypothetical protein